MSPESVTQLSVTMMTGEPESVTQLSVTMMTGEPRECDTIICHYDDR